MKMKRASSRFWVRTPRGVTPCRVVRPPGQVPPLMTPLRKSTLTMHPGVTTSPCFLWHLILFLIHFLSSLSIMFITDRSVKLFSVTYTALKIFTPLTKTTSCNIFLFPQFFLIVFYNSLVDQSNVIHPKCE